jgi:hypothetical protein
MFGAWHDNPEKYAEIYKKGVPFEHVVIPNFFQEEFAEKILSEFPDPDETWWAYDNPFEQKFLFNNFSETHANMKDAFSILNSVSFANKVSVLTSVPNLEPDPLLHSAGLHSYTRNGKVDIHLDYTMHPQVNKERRISLMVYMSKGWNKSWGGSLQLWNSDLTDHTEIDTSIWNTAVFFKTSEDSYHGLPELIACPPGVYRKVIGLYYLSDPRPETIANPRYRAELFPYPGKDIPDKLKALYSIRKSRRLTPEDMADWPEWRKECGLDV